MLHYNNAACVMAKGVSRTRYLHNCACLRRRYVEYKSSLSDKKGTQEKDDKVGHKIPSSKRYTPSWKSTNTSSGEAKTSKFQKSYKKTQGDKFNSNGTSKFAKSDQEPKDPSEVDFSSLKSFIQKGQELARADGPNEEQKSNVEPKPAQSNPAIDFTKLAGIIKSKKKYFDIEQPDFNLDRPNKEILASIRSRSELSKKLQYRDPSNLWKGKVAKFNELKSFFKQLPKRVKINGSIMNDPVRVGDLVTFGTESLRLYIVAETPKSFDSRVATFLSDKGEIVFSSFSNISYRIPQAIPEKYIEIIQNFVCEEQKYLDNPPVGIPDLNFTRSTKSLPLEMQKGRETDGSHELEGEVSEYDSNDLVISQASSQLLTNSNVQTYIIPNAARELYHSALTEISNTAFRKVHDTNMKLEGLHRMLQNDETGEINAPRSISIFEILAKLNTKHETGRLMHVACLGTLPGQSINYDSRDFPAGDYLSVLFALKKQSRLWTVQRDKASFSPTKVIIWPLAQVSHEDRVIEALKGKKLEQIAQYCVGKLVGKANTEEPLLYNSVVCMLKEYVNGKFENDPLVSTTIVSLLRRMDKLLEAEGEMIPDDLYKFEYSFGKAYDLLTRLNEGVNINPVRWSAESNLPGEGISVKADLQESYFQYFDKVYELPEKDDIAQRTIAENLYQEDPLKEMRVDMREVPVYCIDDPTAHEIDDGISIHEEGDKYVVSIHIAEPSSYIKPDSVVGSIAFEKSSTTYLPEAVFPMLPQIVSKLAGLGKDSVDTRTFVVQYSLKKSDVDGYISGKLKDSQYSPEVSLLSKIEKDVYDSSEVKFAVAKRFRQGFTYEAVNNLLQDDDNISKYRESSVSGDADFDNLIKLQHISSILWGIRESNNAYTSGQNKKLTVGPYSGTFDGSKEGTYKLRLPNSDQQIAISPESTNYVSTQLVTENMIIANHLTAKFAADKGIQILYRTLDPKFNQELLEEYKRLIQSESMDINQETLLNLYAFLTRGIISDKPDKHFMMGLNMYTNISSPLRRFIDMINQWKFQDYFLGRTTVSDDCIGGIVSRLNARNDIVRGLQRQSITFWQLLFLKIFNEQNDGNLAEKLGLKLSLRSNPKKGMTVAVNLQTFSSVNAHVEVSQELLEDVESGELTVGGFFNNSKLHLKKIDVIENQLVFEYK
ncbi:MSU1 [Candida metapsilosis]|uniref:MSU1 n=1 Tax=Candida metapsilosis TaxID=273372 RepID=A0A8H7ZI55_9ASCO|nr:MSU1 [Candida metapsilosis]